MIIIKNIQVHILYTIFLWFKMTHTKPQAVFYSAATEEA